MKKIEEWASVEEIHMVSSYEEGRLMSSFREDVMKNEDNMGGVHVDASAFVLNAVQGAKNGECTSSTNIQGVFIREDGQQKYREWMQEDITVLNEEIEKEEFCKTEKGESGKELMATNWEISFGPNLQKKRTGNITIHGQKFQGEESSRAVSIRVCGKESERSTGICPVELKEIMVECSDEKVEGQVGYYDYDEPDAMQAEKSKDTPFKEFVKIFNYKIFRKRIGSVQMEKDRHQERVLEEYAVPDQVEEIRGGRKVRAIVWKPFYIFDHRAGRVIYDDSVELKCPKSGKVMHKKIQERLGQFLPENEIPHNFL